MAKFTVHVSRSHNGLVWPISVELEVKTFTDLNALLDKLQAEHFSPAPIARPSVTGPNNAPPMAQAQAIHPGLPQLQVCPVHGTSMLASKHDDKGMTQTHYCPSREPSGHYCKIRCGLNGQGLLAWRNVPPAAANAT